MQEYDRPSLDSAAAGLAGSRAAAIERHLLHLRGWEQQLTAKLSADILGSKVRKFDPAACLWENPKPYKL